VSKEIKEIIIDLDRSKYPNISHDDAELIQIEAIEKLNNHMKRVVKEYETFGTRYRPEFETVDEANKELGKEKKLKEFEFMSFGHFRRRHEAIALLGERGSGKSNFLVNLKSILGEKDFSYLKILDPTLFEDRQNIIVAIISMIKDKVMDYRDKENFENNEDVLFEKWQKTLQNLAEGLNLIDDGIGNNPMEKDMWDDARLVMQKGLKASKSGYGFERQFHIFLSYTLQLIGKKALILRFDDIDTNPKKGWAVLEVIRKYLTTPHLQIVISGDWKLYSKMVRLQQWQNFKGLIDLDKNYADQKDSVNNLEEQQLTKILQPEYRIYLRTLRHIGADAQYTLLVQNFDGSKTKIEKYLGQGKELHTVTVKDVYLAIFGKVFNLSDNLLENSCSMMMTLPLRTNLQTLRAFEKSVINVDGDKYKIDKIAFMGRFTNVFLTVIDRFDFSYRDFQKLFESSGYSFLTNKLYTFSDKHPELTFDEMITPQVVLEDDKVNLFLLFVYGFVSQSMNENIALFFDWNYRVKLLSKLINLYKNDINTLQEMRMYLDYKKRISTYKVTIKYGGLLIKNDYEDKNTITKSVTNELRAFAYLYSLERQNKVQKPYIALDELEKRIENNYYSENNEKNVFLKLLLSIVLKGVNNKGGKETQVLVSAHYLFGFISNILHNNTVTDLPKVMSYLNILRKFERVDNTNSRISYGDHVYDEETFKKYSNYSLEHEYYGEEDKISSLSKFLIDLKHWKKYFLKKRVLDFTLGQVDDAWNEFETREQKINYVVNAGDYLELQIFVFLNSLLQSIHEKKKILSLEPIVDISAARGYFISNLRKYYKEFEGKIFGEKTTDLKDIIKFVKEKEEINIFEFYLICPLWEYYIDYSYLHIGNVNALNLFTAEKEFSDNEFYSSIFKELVVRTTDDAIEKIHKKRNAKGKSFKEIILDRFEEIDEENMYKINESMYNLIYSVREEFGYKRITKQIINKWITVYQEIKKEKEA